MKPLALRAQESSACLGGHSKLNTEILARNTAKQTYGRSTHRGEVSIRRSNWSNPTLQGPGLRFLPFPPPPVRPCIQQYSWVRLPFPQVGPWVLLPPPFFSRLFHSSLLSPPLSPPSSPSPRRVFVPSLCCPASAVSLLVGLALLRVLLCALALLPARVGFRALSPPPLPAFPSFGLPACCVLRLAVQKYRSVGFDVFSTT